MSKSNDYYLETEQQRLDELSKEQDDRYQAIVEELTKE